MNKLVTSVLLAGLMGAVSIANADSPAKVYEGMLVGPNKMTLYTYDKDVPGSGKSACNEACASNWPPFVADRGARASGDYSLVTRDDGAMQWAYKGKPLYYWSKDKAPGDMTGDGVKGVWHMAQP